MHERAVAAIRSFLGLTRCREHMICPIPMPAGLQEAQVANRTNDVLSNRTYLVFVTFATAAVDPLPHGRYVPARPSDR